MFDIAVCLWYDLGCGQLLNKGNCMRIHDEKTLKDMRNDEDKSKRHNVYKVKMMWFGGVKEELTFVQYYDHSTDVHNPYHVNVYNSKNSYLHSGCGPTIEDSYNDLICSLIKYKKKAEGERDMSNEKLNKIAGVLGFGESCDDSDDRF